NYNVNFLFYPYEDLPPRRGKFPKSDMVAELTLRQGLLRRLCLGRDGVGLAGTTSSRLRDDFISAETLLLTLVINLQKLNELENECHYLMSIGVIFSSFIF
ncbi:hypothetical protein CR513_55749, partial [Mucuna pruriens]